MPNPKLSSRKLMEFGRHPRSGRKHIFTHMDHMDLLLISFDKEVVHVPKIMKQIRTQQQLVEQTVEVPVHMTQDTDESGDGR